MNGLRTLVKEMDFKTVVAALGVILLFFIIALTFFSNSSYQAKAKKERKDYIQNQIEFYSNNLDGGIGVIDTNDFSTPEEFYEAAEDAQNSDLVEIIPSGEDLRRWFPEVSKKADESLITNEEVWENILNSESPADYLD